MSRKKDRKKPRIQSIQATTLHAVDSIELHAHPDGSISFGTEVFNVMVRTEYERKKGAKVINETPTTREHVHFEPNAAITDFDILCAIDTNTQTISGSQISITGIVLGQWADADHDTFAWSVPYCLKLPSSQEPPERMGWFFAIKQLLSDGLLSSAGKIAIVIDSDKEHLLSLNARQQPLVGAAFLPLNMTLLYASSDVGSEYAANVIIRAADRISSELLKGFTSGRFPLDRLLTGNPRCVTKINGIQPP